MTVAPTAIKLWVRGHDDCLKDNLALACNSYEEALIVLDNMKSREEFKRCKIVTSKPRNCTYHDHAEYAEWYQSGYFVKQTNRKHVEQLTKQGLPTSTKVVEKLSTRTTKDQYYYDEWRKSIRLCKFDGKCVCCGRRTYAFTDGENDPRGVLGDSASSSLEATEYGFPEGLKDVPSCFLCQNEEGPYNCCRSIAQKRWAKEAARKEVQATAQQAMKNAQRMIDTVTAATTE